MLGSLADVNYITLVRSPVDNGGKTIEGALYEHIWTRLKFICVCIPDSVLHRAGISESKTCKFKQIGK
jgi:hypothetical protein